MSPQLENEPVQLGRLKGIRGVPTVYDHWSEKKNSRTCVFTVLELLGPNFRSLQSSIPFSNRSGGYSLEVFLASVGLRAMEILEAIQSRDIIHGDVSERNVVIGATNRAELFLIDFGRARPFVDPATGRHNPPTNQAVDPRLSWELLSVFELRGLAPSRRDDVFRLSEVLVALCAGDEALWIGSGEDGRPTAAEALAKKERRDVRFLPTPFRDFYSYTLRLGYEDRPDYETFIGRFAAFANPVDS